jgi:hypothetical protein
MGDMLVASFTSAEYKTAVAAADMLVVLASVVHIGHMSHIGVPVREVQVTDVAVLVFGSAALMCSHLLLGVEISKAVIKCALDRTVFGCHGEPRWNSLRLELVSSMLNVTSKLKWKSVKCKESQLWMKI